MSSGAPPNLAGNRKVGEAMTLLGTLEQRAEAMERDAAAVRKLVEAARDLGEERVSELLGPMLGHNGNGNGHSEVAADERADASPRGREAVRLIVHERPGIWTLRDLRAEMKRRGWFTSNKGVDVAVTRLVANGEARRVGKGRYEFFVGGERRML
jgi:hypothetical protein